MSVSVKNAGLPSGLIGGAMSKIFDLMSIRVVKGQTVVGTTLNSVSNVTYVDEDSASGPVFLSPTDCVVAALMKSAPGVTLATSASGTVTLQVAADAVSAGTAISGARTPGEINTGSLNVGTLTTAIGSNAYVNAQILTGALTAGGRVNVTLLVMNAKFPQ